MQPTDSANHRLQETYVPWSDQDRSLPIVLTFFLLLFFLVGFFSLYLFRYVMDYLNTLHQTPTAAAALRGLPTSVISSFPTFAYSSLKGVQHGNDRLECTVCLAEFSDDDMLRMLTGCSHVFHQECIDLWLETHTTCPVCRWDLDDGKDKKAEVVIPMPESNGSGEGEGEGEGEGAAERRERRNSFKEDGSREGEGEGAAERQERWNSFKEDGSRKGEGEGATERQECRNSFKEDGGRAEGVNNGPDGRRQHREQLLEGQLT